MECTGTAGVGAGAANFASCSTSKSAPSTNSDPFTASLAACWVAPCSEQVMPCEKAAADFTDHFGLWRVKASSTSHFNIFITASDWLCTPQGYLLVCVTSSDNLIVRPSMLKGPAQIPRLPCTIPMIHMTRCSQTLSSLWCRWHAQIPALALKPCKSPIKS